MPVRSCGVGSVPCALVPRGAVLTALGRQALGLVAQELRQRRISSLLAPAYSCPTMVVPFQLEGIGVHEVATGRDLLMDAAELADKATGRSGIAVLHCETVGNLAGVDLAGVLAGLQSRGVPVVVDQTHSLLGTTHIPGDYSIASLRKLLPVPDGAWVSGLADAPSLTRSTADEEASDRLGEALQRGPGWIRRRADAEVSLDELWAPAAIGPRTLDALRALDTSVLLAERRRNAVQLLGALPGVALLNPAATEGCLAISHPRADWIADRLVAVGIVGPVHWSRPEGLRPGRRWRTDVLTLPVDRRLTAQELSLVTSLLG